ncbi:MAG: hypothetical protein IBX72_14180, partial [Nitrospirae bacterium]|nr:hypothetical protein [Nitrospirota bacterium]
MYKDASIDVRCLNCRWYGADCSGADMQDSAWDELTCFESLKEDIDDLDEDKKMGLISGLHNDINIKSVVSYPHRGLYGDAKWRGNCPGRLIKDLLLFFKPKYFCDPAEGGGTSRDVAREFGIRYVGLDLHTGFNILRDSLLERLGDPADYVFFHPPYWDIITYSGNVWGTAPHPDDLSRSETYEEFIKKLQTAFYNIYEALASNGHYSVLVGDIRKSGRLWSIQADVVKMAPGVVESIVIKEQHNCFSDKISYSGKFIPIVHEYCINLRKDRFVIGFLDAAVKTSLDLVTLSNATWKAVVGWALKNLGGKARLQEIY